MTKMVAGFRCVFPEIARYLGAVLFLCLSCQGPGGPAEPRSGAPAGAPSQDPSFLDAMRDLRATDLEAALVQLDQNTGRYGEDPAFWELYAETTLQLIERELAAGRSISFLPADALAAAEQALALEPGRTSARVLLAKTLRLNGDTEAAWTAAEQAWAELDRDQADAAQLEEIGRCGLQRTVQAIQAGEAVPAAADVAAQALQASLARGSRSASLPLFDLRAWQQQWEAAAEAARIGLLTAPPVEVLYERLRGLSGAQRNLQVATLEEVRRARPADALLLWYLGEALFFQGREARTALDTQKAAESYQRAEECFLQAQSAQSDFSASCQDWLHLLRVQQAWTLRDEGRHQEAGALLVEILTAAPARLEPAADPDTLRLAIEAVAADFFRDNDLGGAREFLGAICRVHGNDANWLNNLGLACRDLGVTAAESGDAAGAALLFEESWGAYSRAVELAPEDARIVNDRALIAVYYLDEHWDLAERELHRSIQIGTRQLAELPADVPEAEHRYVDEAVGDAWENLAYLQLVRRHRTEMVEEFLSESVKHFPFERRQGVALLRARLAEALR